MSIYKLHQDPRSSHCHERTTLPLPKSWCFNKYPRRTRSLGIMCEHQNSDRPAIPTCQWSPTSAGVQPRTSRNQQALGSNFAVGINMSLKKMCFKLCPLTWKCSSSYKLFLCIYCNFIYTYSSHIPTYGSDHHGYSHVFHLNCTISRRFQPIK